MTPAMVSDIAQALPQLLGAKLNSSPQEGKGAVSANVGATVSRDSKPIPADTISISDQSRQTISDVKKEEAKREAASRGNNSEASATAMSKVQFVYDLKGELSIRYMDASNNLIYQVPTERMLRLKEAASKADSSVDTKV